MTYKKGIKVVCGIPEAEQGIYDIAAVQQVNKAYGLAFEMLPAFVGGGKKSVAAGIRTRQSVDDGLIPPRIRIAAVRVSGFGHSFLHPAGCSL